jgi:hypothetical protein
MPTRKVDEGHTNADVPHEDVLTEAPAKTDLINHLAAVRGCRRYLEICSIGTGHLFARLDRSRLECHRLMYRCPPGHSDGMNIDFRSPDLDTSKCLREIEQKGLSYDVILVDPFHEYETSRRDIETALRLLAPGGTIVVHDCLPPDETIASPTMREGSWCGVTYKAYVDLVTAREDLLYYTVDTDFGCGIIRHRPGSSTSDAPFPPGPSSEIIRAWQALGHDFPSVFQFFQQHHRSLLRLISVADFFRIEASATSAV